MATPFTTSQRIGGMLPRSVRARVRRGVVRWRHRGLRPEDALLVSYPKSGSSWLRMLLSESITGQSAGFDTVRRTVPPIGSQARATAILPRAGRLVRSHEPLAPGYVPDALRVVYLMRDVRDVIVSLHHHTLRMGQADSGIEGFTAQFLAGEVDNFGTWPDHVARALDRHGRDGESTLVVRYEDLLSDPAAEAARILAFLGVAVPAPQIEAAVLANGFAEMRRKEQESSFLRTRGDAARPVVRHGRSGTWRTELPPRAQALVEQKAGPALARAGYDR